jgi:hypothetical protein
LKIKKTLKTLSSGQIYIKKTTKTKKTQKKTTVLVFFKIRNDFTLSGLDPTESITSLKQVLIFRF